MSDNGKYNASASLVGYLFQCRLALLRGLELAKKLPSATISIEKFDDISFESMDYAQCLIQAKHHVKPKSLDDKSVDVWKTLLIWIGIYKEGIFQADKTRYFLITTSFASKDSAISRLREEATLEQRKEARTLLRNAANSSKDKTTELARKLFLDLSDEDADIFLSNIIVIDNHPNLTDVFSQIESELILVAPKNTELAAEYLEGWWLNVVGKHLVEEKHSTIHVQHIITKANEIGRSLHKDSLPLDDPKSLAIKEYSQSDEDRIFVRQMRAINLPNSNIQSSVYDYYRAYAQRSKWARENLILENELGNYDDKLEDSWKRKCSGELLISNPKNDTQKLDFGLKLFVWAIQESIPLRNIVEKWITAGSYHSLADQLRVGWHPEYVDLFKEQELQDG
ncbi:MAG: hypothetical protein J0L55_06135 [Caulobacterales bacterium]|nr:hypothetical protein [Caulobacterales bacterium]MCA0373616.1 hypothetical protein [Pseudomonadota bacterium]